MDARNNVLRPIFPFFDNIDSHNALLANPDSWPDETPFSSQFFSDCNPVLYTELTSRFNLHREYFQSTLMLFDTSLLDENTLSDIALLFHEFPRIVSSDQPIFSLYWDQIRRSYRQLPYRLPQTQEVPYDFSKRISSARYIITAWRE